MKRKPGTLLPLELEVCAAAQWLNRDVHGFELAKALAEGDDRKRLTAYGTLYRALGRLEAMALLASRWEDPHLAARAGRPLRRLYRLTALGERALKEATANQSARAARRRSWAPA